MENDSIRASGSTTLIDIWIEGKLRAITVTQGAIETYLGERAPKAMSENDRCEFVRTHLAQVVAAVHTRLRGNAGTGSIVIDGPQLLTPGARSKGKRRMGDRRKTEVSPENLPRGERRRGERRGGERRRSANPSET